MSRLILVLALAAALVGWGCNGTPTPDQVSGDVPSVPDDQTANDGGTNDQPDQPAADLKILPESVRLDVSELAQAAASGQDAPPGPIGSLATANQETERTLNQLDEITSRFAQINPLVTDAAATQISGTITWDTRVEGGMPGPGQTRVPNPGAGEGEERQIKVDFSAFDFDGDNQPDGSGLPYVVPVAIRVWVTDSQGVFKPAACGIISILPTEDNPGAGELLTLSYARNGDGDIARVRWNQTDASDKQLETWDEHPSGCPNNPAPESGDTQPLENNCWGYSSFLVEHKRVGDVLEKTVKSTIDMQMVACRYLEGAVAAIVRSYDGQYDQMLMSPPNIEYRNLSTSELATPEDALDVSVDYFDLLPLPDPARFESWPAEFPLEPTF